MSEQANTVRQQQHFVLTLASAVRTAGYYDVGNAVMQKACKALNVMLREQGDEDGLVKVSAYSHSMFLNGTRVPTTVSTYERFNFLIQSFQDWGIVSLSFLPGLTEEDLTKALVILAGIQQAEAFELEKRMAMERNLRDSLTEISKALAKFERFRCRLDGDRLTPIETDAVGVAVDEGNELFVLPVATPTTKTVEQISAEIRQNVERLRSGDPQSRRIHPALLTISNLGVCNVEAFVPIINPPEAAILGVGRVVPTPVVKSDGSIGIEPRCTLTLSVDHRITSGKYAGDFLAAIVEELESL